MERTFYKMKLMMNEMVAKNLKEILKRYNREVVIDENIVTIILDKFEIKFICYQREIYYIVHDIENNYVTISNKIHPSTVLHTKSLINKINKLYKKVYQIDLERNRDN